MFQLKARILANNQVSPDCFHMSLQAAEIAQAAKPGQFIQVRCNNTLEPLLRRPFGIHSLRNEHQIDILYKIVGKGTAVLSEKRQDEELDIIGPLGNGFSLLLPGNSVILIGGGVGIAPLLFLAERLIQIKNSTHIHVIIGAKTKESVLCKEEFEDLPPGGANRLEVCTATEDGSSGFKGTATNLLEEILSANDGQATTIYASGPQAMLEQTARISREREISCQLSLEEIIACGFGVCLGCTVRTREGHKLVCKDGPVFNRTQLLW